jgi:hypothetical protein
MGMFYVKHLICILEFNNCTRKQYKNIEKMCIIKVAKGGQRDGSSGQRVDIKTLKLI